MMPLAGIGAAEMRHRLADQVAYRRKAHVLKALSCLGRKDTSRIGEELMEPTVGNLRQNPVCSQKVADVCWQPCKLAGENDATVVNARLIVSALNVFPVAHGAVKWPNERKLSDRGAVRCSGMVRRVVWYVS